MAGDLDASTAVSVIIPTFNRPEFLVRAVQSVLAQTHKPIEVIVCDDGSPRDVEPLLREVAARMGSIPVRLLRLPHSGRPAGPRNRGVAESRGRWLAFLDDDDEWAPDKLERQLEAMQSHAALASSVAASGGHGYRAATRVVQTLRLATLVWRNAIVTSGVVVDRSVLQRTGGFPEDPRFRAIEDYVAWLKVGLLTDWVLLEEPLVAYRDDSVNSIRGAASRDEYRKMRLVFTEVAAWAVEAGLAASISTRVAMGARLVREIVLDFVARIRASRRTA